jgi:hypothetical protein
MNIKVSLQGNAFTSAGIDRTAAVSDIEAEINKLAKTLSVKPRRKETPAPDGAQGELEIIEWIIKVAKDPKMAALYAKALIFAVNQIIEAWQSRKHERSDTHDDEADKKVKPPVKVTLSGKSIALPATTVAIQKFLKSLENDS